MYSSGMSLFYKNPETDVFKQISLRDLADQLRKKTALDADLDVNSLSYNLTERKFIPARVTLRLLPEHHKMVSIRLHNRIQLRVAETTPVFTLARSWVKAGELRDDDKVLSAGALHGKDAALPLKVLQVDKLGMEEVYEVLCEGANQNLFIQTVLVRPSNLD